MNTTFHPYRAHVWSGLKRYFVEWRKRALTRHSSFAGLARLADPCAMVDGPPALPEKVSAWTPQAGKGGETIEPF
jgi:hypothetical protein